MISTTGNTFQPLLLGLLASSLVACGDPPTAPEEAIRAWAARGQQLVEAQERGELMDMVSADYADSRGNDRDDIENLFRYYFLRAHDITLLTSIDDVRVFGDSAAELDLTVGMAASHNGTLGFSAEAYSFELELVRDGDDWSLISGRWGEAGGQIH